MPRSTDRGAMLGCFPTGGRLPTSPPSAVYEEGSTSAASTSVGTGSPPSSASTSSPAFLDEVGPLYPDSAEAEADAGGLSTAIASHRFFPARPGRSNSIVDSSEHASTAAPATGSSPGHRLSSQRAVASVSDPLRVAHGEEVDDETVRSVSVSTDAPRAEFLKSMVEMADALGLDPRRGADRARLHDLLLCYIALNDSDALRDILGAFTELLCLLNGNNTTAGAAGDRTQPTTPPVTSTTAAESARAARHR